MMRLTVARCLKRSFLLLCSSAIIAGLACGKYGRPERISQPDPSVAASDDGTEQGRDETQKSRKP
jgi:hypothetical protein